MKAISNQYQLFCSAILSVSLTLVASHGVQAEVEMITQQNLDDSCARVKGVEDNDGAYIFKESNVYSEQLGVVANGRYVEIEGEAIDNYFPISVPLQGYIHKDFVTSCITAQPPQNCLQVASAEGISIYKEPSVQSETLGMVSSGRNMRVTKAYGNEWVSVVAPIGGYARVADLTTCPPARFG